MLSFRQTDTERYQLTRADSSASERAGPSVLLCLNDPNDELADKRWYRAELLSVEAEMKVSS